MKNSAQPQDIKYYALRLEEILNIYRKEGRKLIDQNLGKVKTLVNKYKSFKEDSRYDSSLVGAVETFALRI